MRQSENLYYLLTDHLGSTTVTTDASGNLVSELRYAPWGEVRSGSAPTNYTFTGQYSNTSDFGLMFYNARWYDPALGRMAQADTIVPGGPQGLDRYAYVNNSPLNFTDPSGHFIVEDEDCTQLSCSNDPDPGDVKRLRRQAEEIAQLVEMVDQLIQACSQSPWAPGCQVTPPPPGGYSDPELDALYAWWDTAVRNVNDLAWANDLYNLTGRGGWKAVRYGLNLTVLEVFVQGSRQVYRDSSAPILTPRQRALRPIVVGMEAGLTDLASGVVGAGFAGAGFVAAGPPGAGFGYLAGAVLTTNAAEGTWSQVINPTIFADLGSWP